MKKLVILCGFIMVFLSCDDILEVEDISDEVVTALAPLEGSMLSNNSVNFNWDTVREASAYRIQIAQPNFENAQQLLLDSILTVDSVGNVATQINQTLLNGNYVWRIRAFNSGFTTVFTTNAFQVNGDEDIDLEVPNTPQLVAPANGTVQDETLVNFSWTREDVPGTAERDSIFFFSDEALQMQVGSELGANNTFSANFSPGTFYWFVQAFDAAGNESGNSETFNFTIN